MLSEYVGFKFKRYVDGTIENISFKNLDLISTYSDTFVAKFIDVFRSYQLIS